MLVDGNDGIIISVWTVGLRWKVVIVVIRILQIYRGYGLHIKGIHCL